jgi:hypothetical protein
MSNSHFKSTLSLFYFLNFFYIAIPFLNIEIPCYCPKCIFSLTVVGYIKISFKNINLYEYKNLTDLRNFLTVLFCYNLRYYCQNTVNIYIYIYIYVYMSGSLFHSLAQFGFGIHFKYS